MGTNIKARINVAVVLTIMTKIFPSTLPTQNLMGKMVPSREKMLWEGPRINPP